ncbi:hypothetical protein RvY_15528 [Ramazzottius varieornatus]|uniref:Uncharacterized protein n=1 Tax=Ramazzottius varieornatus TaxID=947166 RepID=A0A1D1VWT2_RAMVA|nr:hypothetical protein RvY_15528 [Ramazzottius varieornatus]
MPKPIPPFSSKPIAPSSFDYKSNHPASNPRCGDCFKRSTNGPDYWQSKYQTSSAKSSRSETESESRSRSRPVSYGSSTQAGSITLSSSRRESRYSSPTRHSRGEDGSFLYSDFSTPPRHVPVRPTCVDDRAEQRAAKLAHSFSHMHIGRDPPGTSSSSFSSRSLPHPLRISHSTAYQPSALSLSNIPEDPEITVANRRIGTRLQKIYAKPVTKHTKPITIRSRWELAESERHREIHRINKVVSQKIIRARNGPPLPAERTR